MKREDTNRMAREAGFEFTSTNHLKLSGADWHTEECVQEYLERFAALVAAAEREACARVAEWCIQNHIEQHTPEQIKARGTP